VFAKTVGKTAKCAASLSFCVRNVLPVTRCFIWVGIGRTLGNADLMLLLVVLDAPWSVWMSEVLRLRNSVHARGYARGHKVKRYSLANRIQLHTGKETYSGHAKLAPNAAVWFRMAPWAAVVARNRRPETVSNSERSQPLNQPVILRGANCIDFNFGSTTFCKIKPCLMVELQRDAGRVLLPVGR